MPTPLDAVMNGAKPAVTIQDLEKNRTMEVPRQEVSPQSEVPKEVKPESQITKSSVTEPSFDFEKSSEQKTDTPIEPASETPIEEPAKGTIEENLKAMRKLINENKTALKTKETELEEVKTKLTRYEKGEIFPEIIQEKENEIARLSQFERLHSLKTSREYREAIIKPLEALTLKLDTIAKDYELPPEIIKQALNLTNRAELNRFLTNHFDDVGALEVKGILTDIQNLQDKAKLAEAEPAQALASLQSQYQEFETARKKQKLGVVANVSRKAWADSLTSIQNEGQIHELIMDEGDSEHNENYVKPILNQAAAEYGKLVTMLAEAGLEDLPESLAKALAKMTQLAHASAVSISSREAAVQRAKELEKNTARSNIYHRPSMHGAGGGGTGGSGSVLSAEKPIDSKSASSEILSKVMGKK